MEDKKIRLGAAEASEPLGAGVTCPACGYDLRGCVSDRCSECGRDLADVRSGRTMIPWADRRRVGRLRGFVRTAVWATFRPRSFARNTARPAFYHDSRRFRWICTLILVLSIVVTACMVNWSAVSLGRCTSLRGDVQRLSFAASLVGFAALAALTPGVASYRFHSRRLSVVDENHAIAMGYYAAASWAFAPLVVMLIWGGVWLGLRFLPEAAPLLEQATTWAPLGLAALPLLTGEALAGVLLREPWLRRVGRFLLGNLAFAVVAAVLWTLPFVALGVVVCYHSLT